MGPITPRTGRPEVELLLCCARTRVESERAERIRALLQEKIDWAYLMRTALRHGVIPLLYRGLNTTCPQAVPKAILDRLRIHFHSVALFNLLLTRELPRLLEALEAQCIPALPLKGAILAVSVYGNLALRQFSDLDILVRPEDVARAGEVLVSQGFQPLPGTLSEAERLYNRKASLLPEYHTGFLREDGRLSVELHWNIVPEQFSARLPDRVIWERLERVPFGDNKVHTLAPESLLLVLCLHGAKHLWESLKWIVDIAELCRARPDLDWQQVMGQAKELGKERVLFLGLRLATEVLGAEIPARVRSQIRADAVVRDLCGQAREWLFRDGDGRISLSERWNFYLRLKGWRRERLRQRLRYLLASFQPTPADRALLPLPTSLSFLYYALRPVRLLGKYSLQPFQRLLRRSDDANRMNGTRSASASAEGASGASRSTPSSS